MIAKDDIREMVNRFKAGKDYSPELGNGAFYKTRLQQRINAMKPVKNNLQPLISLNKGKDKIS